MTRTEKEFGDKVTVEGNFGLVQDIRGRMGPPQARGAQQSVNAGMAAMTTVIRARNNPAPE